MMDDGTMTIVTSSFLKIQATDLYLPALGERIWRHRSCSSRRTFPEYPDARAAKKPEEAKS